MELMRRAIYSILLGTVLCALNYLGVIAGILDPPAGFQSMHYILNLDVPQYLTWAELAKNHWLLPDYHAPWKTEPALFQPMLLLVGKLGLPIVVSYYLLQLLTYWVAAYALIQAAMVFCKTRREMFYAAVVVLCAIPVKVFGWIAGRMLGWPVPVTALLSYGVVEYAYDSADGLLRGGLSNSFTLTFGTAITLFAFTNLAKFVTEGKKRHYYWLLTCVFLDGLFHPFEIFLITVAAVWPLVRVKRVRECVLLFAAAGAGMLPYVIQTVRSPWVRDASDLAQWHMGSPAWVLFVYGMPAILACWLMLLKFRTTRPEDEILQCWFIAASLLPMIPAIPGSMHIFDGFAYCVGFLLVRKAHEDKLFSKLFADRPVPMRAALAVWALVSIATLGVIYAQVWKDGKSADPEMFLSTVRPKAEPAMVAWMKANLPHDGLVLAPEKIAPWVATIPMPSLGSHDLFSITYETQRKLADRFYGGEDVRPELIDGFGVSYVIAPASAPVKLGDARVVHGEGDLRLYEIPGQTMKPYPGAANIAGAAKKNAFRQWVFALIRRD